MNDCHSSKNIARNLSNHPYQTTEPFFHSNVVLYQQQHQNQTAETIANAVCCSVLMLWHGSIPNHIFLYFGIHSGLVVLFYVLSCTNCRNIVIFSFFFIYINMVIVFALVIGRECFFCGWWTEMIMKTPWKSRQYNRGHKFCISYTYRLSFIHIA